MFAWLRNSLLLIAACWAADGALFHGPLPLDRTVNPVAGLAVGGLLVGGWRLLPAVFVAAWGVAAAGPAAEGYGLVAAAFSTLQAVVAATLVRQFCPRPLALVRFREILLFLLIVGPFAAVVVPTLRYAVSDLHQSHALEAWLRDYAREAFGGLLLTPVVLALFAAPREVWRPRVRTVAAPLAAVAAGVLAVHEVARQGDATRTHRHLAQTAEVAAVEVEAEGRRLAEIMALHRRWVQAAAGAAEPEAALRSRLRDVRGLFPAADGVAVHTPADAPPDVRAAIERLGPDRPLAATPLAGPGFAVVAPLDPARDAYLVAQVDAARLLAETRAVTHPHLAARLAAADAAGPAAGEARHPVAFADRAWQVVVTADAEYLRTRATPYAWLAFAASLVAAFLLAALFLSLTGQTAAVRAEVERITAELSAEHDARVAVEAALAEARRDAALGRLAGGVAHEFNNLFTAVLGHTGRAGDQLSGSHPAQVDLHKAEQAVAQAGELCQQILAFTGRGTTVRHSLDLAAFLPAVVADVRSRLPNAPAVEVRAAQAEVRLVGDALLIRRLVTNLLVNAAEAYAEPGGRIVVACGADGDPVWLTVTDAGCGMPADVRDRAFEPFFSTKAPGRGLGLAAVRGIAQTHDGTVGLTTAPGGGTAVEVRFPNRAAWDLATTPPPAHNPTRPNVTAAALPAAVTGGVVVVVDDDPTVRELAAVTLRAGGCEVQTAENGEDAVALVRREGDRVRLVVLDLLMPKMDGATALLHLRRRAPKLPVIVMSAYSDFDLSGEFTAGTPTVLLRKPFRPADLLASVADLFHAAGV